MGESVNQIGGNVLNAGSQFIALHTFERKIKILHEPQLILAAYF